MQVAGDSQVIAMTVDQSQSLKLFSFCVYPPSPKTKAQDVKEREGKEIFGGGQSMRLVGWLLEREVDCQRLTAARAPKRDFLARVATIKFASTSRSVLIAKA